MIRRLLAWLAMPPAPVDECEPDWHVFDGPTCIKCGKTEGDS